jgi:hypothetical protein
MSELSSPPITLAVLGVAYERDILKTSKDTVGTPNCLTYSLISCFEGAAHIHSTLFKDLHMDPLTAVAVSLFLVWVVGQNQGGHPIHLKKCCPLSRQIT